MIYHRGTPVDPTSGLSGASAYEQAGVAVPRGLPAERGAVPGPAGADPRARYGNPATASSPYSGSASPYSRGRSSESGDPATTRSRPSDHPDYAVPRGGDRPGPPQVPRTRADAVARSGIATVSTLRSRPRIARRGAARDATLGAVAPRRGSVLTRSRRPGGSAIGLERRLLVWNGRPSTTLRQDN